MAPYFSVKITSLCPFYVCLGCGDTTCYHHNPDVRGKDRIFTEKYRAIQVSFDEEV